MSGENGASAEYYNGGVTLIGGTHFAVLSQNGVPSLMRFFGNEDGGGQESWAMDPDEMFELAGAMKRAAESAEAYRSQR